eukprot:7180314-Prymnesium_polylepis.1
MDPAEQRGRSTPTRHDPPHSSARTTTRTPLVGAIAIRTHARDAPAALHGRWLGMRVLPEPVRPETGRHAMGCLPPARTRGAEQLLETSSDALGRGRNWHLRRRPHAEQTARWPYESSKRTLAHTKFREGLITENLHGHSRGRPKRRMRTQPAVFVRPNTESSVVIVGSHTGKSKF